MYFPLILVEKSSFSRKNALFLKFFAKKFGSNKKMPTFAIPNETNTVSKHAEVAQLVEHNLAKVGVASSSLVFCSKRGHLRMTLNFENHHPTGFNHMSVVLVHKGRLFCFMSTPLPARICISLIIRRSKIKKRPPSKESDLEYDATREPFRKRHP